LNAGIPSLVKGSKKPGPNNVKVHSHNFFFCIKSKCDFKANIIKVYVS